MSIRKFARHDLAVLARSGTGRLLVGLAVASVLGAVGAGLAMSNGPLTDEFLMFTIWLVPGIAVPFVATLTAAVSISSARDSGRLRLLFGTPITRLDVFAGTLLSRTVATLVAVAVGVAIGAVAVVALPIASFGNVVRAVAFLFLASVTYTAVGVAISALATTRVRAIGAAIGFFVASALWPHLVRTFGPTSDFGPAEPTAAETLTSVVGTLSPFGAFSQAATTERAIYAVAVTHPLLSTSTMVVVLLCWTLVPVLVAYRSFASTDL
ncbi:ABC transporter permease subunit [Halorubellus sp. PRR65]|uniref:ABC transporter permease subunit n=1 Tax=Halorubellus sp. PRR65 TaxID=3098148 RepID=UPI002B25EC51|nr:ABC transporter permease subunit [Halorubellus sp. PRR65]